MSRYWCCFYSGVSVQCIHQGGVIHVGCGCCVTIFRKDGFSCVSCNRIAGITASVNALARQGKQLPFCEHFFSFHCGVFANISGINDFLFYVTQNRGFWVCPRHQCHFHSDVMAQTRIVLCPAVV